MTALPPFKLVLTQGGGALLIDPELGDDLVVWSSMEDAEFIEEFPNFLVYEDVADILDYLVEAGELTDREADRADIVEEFVKLPAK